MKSLLTILTMALCFATGLHAQETGFTVGYQGISARQWNIATQTYNFSRPFLAEKQPLLRHGGFFNVYRLRRSSTRFTHGPFVAGSWHRSRAENPNFNIDIHAFLLDLGWKFQYQLLGTDNDRLLLSFNPSVTGVMLSRRLNGEVVVVGESEEDRSLRNPGVGLGLNAALAYRIPISDGMSLAPMCGVSYDPFVWAYRAEVVFNESRTGPLKAYTGILRFQAGVSFILKAAYQKEKA